MIFLKAVVHRDVFNYLTMPGSYSSFILLITFVTFVNAKRREAALSWSHVFGHLKNVSPIFIHSFWLLFGLQPIYPENCIYLANVSDSIKNDSLMSSCCFVVS